MHRRAAWLLTLALVAPLSARAAELPQSVTVDDGRGTRIELRLAGVVEGGTLVSGFGWRSNPMGGGGAPHAGIDIKATRGAPVRAAASGTVVEIAWGADFGRFVRLRHSDRLDTVYAHLARVIKPLKVGDTVTADEAIGQVGSTGRSTGPHLHFEVRRNGWPIDPLGAKPARKTKAKTSKAPDAGL